MVRKSNVKSPFWDAHIFLQIERYFNKENNTTYDLSHLIEESLPEQLDSYAGRRSLRDTRDLFVFPAVQGCYYYLLYELSTFFPGMDSNKWYWLQKKAEKAAHKHPFFMFLELSLFIWPLAFCVVFVLELLMFIILFMLPGVVLLLASHLPLAPFFILELIWMLKGALFFGSIPSFVALLPTVYSAFSYTYDWCIDYFGDGPLIQYLSAIPSYVTELNLANNQLSELSDDELTKLMTVIPKNVAHIKLDSNGLSEAQISALQEQRRSFLSAPTFF